jgi:excisionase family DNA binding protein
MGTELLTPAELAERLKVQTQTITNWRRRSIIPAIRINATTYRFCFEDVLNALRDKSAPPAAPEAPRAGGSR